MVFGTYTLVGNFITFPTKRSEKVMSTFKHKQGEGEKIYSTVTYPLTKFISKFIRMENYQKRKLEKDLQRAGIRLTPIEYNAKAYVTAGLTILSSFLFIPSDLTVITMCVLILGIVLFSKERQSVKGKLKKITIYELRYEIQQYGFHTSKIT